MDPVPLPQNPFSQSAFQIAYSQCLALEADAPVLQPIPNHPPPIVCARIMGHLLCLAPAEKAQEQLQREISLANDHMKLIQLATVYLNNFIRTFKRSNRRTPAPSEHSSRLSSEDTREYSQTMMETLDHRSARTYALRRDGHCCMLTKGMDISQRDGVVYLETAHIIPQSPDKKIDRDVNKRHQSSGIWVILSMFFEESFLEDLAGNHIHRLENMLTLEINMHRFFDDLYLWLKPVDGQPNKYCLFVAKEGTRRFNALPEYVTFSTDTDIPLPNPKYLALHALCCEVAWMSGAIEYIMDMESRMEDSTVMANDGSSADLLMAALSLVDTRGTDSPIV